MMRPNAGAPKGGLESTHSPEGVQALTGSQAWQWMRLLNDRAGRQRRYARRRFSIQGGRHMSWSKSETFEDSPVLIDTWPWLAGIVGSSPRSPATATSVSGHSSRTQRPSRTLGHGDLTRCRLFADSAVNRPRRENSRGKNSGASTPALRKEGHDGDSVRRLGTRAWSVRCSEAPYGPDVGELRRRGF